MGANIVFEVYSSQRNLNTSDTSFIRILVNEEPLYLCEQNTDDKAQIQKPSTHKEFCSVEHIVQLLNTSCDFKDICEI